MHFWLHHAARKDSPYECISASAEKVGQGAVGGVTHRVTCTWWLLGFKAWLSMCHGWDKVGRFTLLSPCRGFILGREGYLVSEPVFDNPESADYYMFINEWVWLGYESAC